MCQYRRPRGRGARGEFDAIHKFHCRSWRHGDDDTGAPPSPRPSPPKGIIVHMAADRRWNLAAALQEAGADPARRPTPSTWLKIATALRLLEKSTSRRRRTVRRMADEAVAVAEITATWSWCGHPTCWRRHGHVDGEGERRRYMAGSGQRRGRQAHPHRPPLEDALRWDVDHL